MRFWRRTRDEDLLDQTLLVATTGAGLEPGEHVLEAELDVGVRSGFSADGRPELPAFTSEERLIEWVPEGSHWIGLGGRDLLHLFLSNSEWEVVVIDPPRRSMEVTRSVAQRLLQAVGE